MSRAGTMFNPTDGFWDIRESAKSFNDRFAASMSLHDDGSGERPADLAKNGLWANTPSGSEVTSVYQYNGKEDVLVWTVHNKTGEFTLSGHLKDDDADTLRELLGLPAAPTAMNALAPLRVNKHGSGFEYGDAREQSMSTPGLRNLVVSGREKDGYPAYLVSHEFLNMECALNVPATPVGTVTTSSNYSAAYDGTLPLRNQVAYAGNGWLTPNNTRQGYWQYQFSQPRVLTGLFLTVWEATATPKNWKLLGWNEGTQDWDAIYTVENNPQMPVGTSSAKTQGRMHWFTHNTKAYSVVRIQVDDVTGVGNNRISIQSLKFFEPVIQGLAHNEIALYATGSEPFRASIACGHDDENKPADHALIITSPVKIKSSILREMSRNYLYMAPALPDGSCPEYLDAQRAQFVPEAKAWLAAGNRKVLYGSVKELERQCVALLQCQQTQDAAAASAATFHSLGAYRYPIMCNTTSISTTERPRGAVSSFGLLTGTSGYICPNENLNAAGREQLAVDYPAAQDFTVELDFKLVGVSATSDSVLMLFDAGWTGSKGLFLRYYSLRKQITVYCNGAESFAVPFAADENWHSLSVSSCAGNIFLHIDGKCLASFDAFPQIRSNSAGNRWMLGRRSDSGSEYWKGYLNNFRYTIGQCLYQSEDYAVDSVFSLSLIPDKTLWWDSACGVVKEWQAGSGSWKETPLLPIGHIDTGYKDHLHSDTPQGVFADGYGLTAVESFADVGSSAAVHTACKLFNFGQGGHYPFATAAATNKTTTCEASFILRKPLAFEELRIIGISSAWGQSPVLFVFEGSLDGENWDALVDRSAYVNEGSINYGAVHYLGAVPNISSWKRYPIAVDTAYKRYRIRFLPNGEITNYAGANALRLQLPLRGASPLVNSITSYSIGGVMHVGPLYMEASKTYSIPLPFGGARFEVTGKVNEWADFESKARALGTYEIHMSGTTSCYSGEVLYTKEDELIIHTGSTGISINMNNSSNSSVVAANSTYADVSITARRVS